MGTSWVKIRWLKSQKSSVLTSGSVNAPIIHARQCSSSSGEAMIMSEKPAAPSRGSLDSVATYGWGTR